MSLCKKKKKDIFVKINSSCFCVNLFASIHSHWAFIENVLHGCVIHTIFFYYKIHEVKGISFYAVLENDKYHALKLFFVASADGSDDNHMPDINSEETILFYIQ